MLGMALVYNDEEKYRIIYSLIDYEFRMKNSIFPLEKMKNERSSSCRKLLELNLHLSFIYLLKDLLVLTLDSADDRMLKLGINHD